MMTVFPAHAHVHVHVHYTCLQHAHCNIHYYTTCLYVHVHAYSDQGTLELNLCTGKKQLQATCTNVHYM